MGAETEFPWTDIPSEVVANGQLQLSALVEYFKRPKLKHRETGACCNCGRIMSIQSHGLCCSCYNAAKGKTGADLLNALTGVRARLTQNVTRVDTGKIGALGGGNTDADDDDHFEPPKVIKKIEITDPKYVEASDDEKLTGLPSESDYEKNIADGSECPECIKSEGVQCDEVFLVDDSDPDEHNIVGPLGNPNVAVNATLRAEADETMEENQEGPALVEVGSENHEIEFVTPVVKSSVVIEFGDAELEFRAGSDTVDIKVEDGGDLIFFARNIEKVFLKALTALL